jgi:hypothetical protein
MSLSFWRVVGFAHALLEGCCKALSRVLGNALRRTGHDHQTVKIRLPKPTCPNKMPA